MQSLHGLARDFALFVPRTVCPHSRLNVYVLIITSFVIVDCNITSTNYFVKYKLIVQVKIISTELDLYNDRPISRFTEVSGAYNHLSY